MKIKSNLWVFLLLLIVFGCQTKNPDSSVVLSISSPAELSPTLAIKKVLFRSTQTNSDKFATNYLVASLDLEYRKEFSAKWNDVNLSDDGRHLIYTTSATSMDEEVHMFDLLTEKDINLFDTSNIPGTVAYLGIDDPSLSSDGKHVVFQINISNDEFGLGLFSFEDKSIQIITKEGFNSEPKLSVDGKKILSICEGREAVGFQICIMNINGSDRRTLTDTEGYHEAWLSSDGEHVVYQETLTQFFGDPIYGLYSFDTNGSNLMQLYNQSVHFLAFSSDGKDIVFCAYKKNALGPCEGIYMIGVNGDNLKRLSYFDGEFLSNWK